MDFDYPFKKLINNAEKFIAAFFHIVLLLILFILIGFIVFDIVSVGRGV